MLRTCLTSCDVTCALRCVAVRSEAGAFLTHREAAKLVAQSFARGARYAAVTVVASTFLPLLLFASESLSHRQTAAGNSR